MIKKFLNSLLGDNNEQQQNTSTSQSSNQYEKYNDTEEHEADADKDDSEPPKLSFDPVTHHGLHYSKEQFDAEVERRVNAWMQENGQDQDVRNIRANIGPDVFADWNPGAPYEQLTKFHREYSSSAFGYTTYENAKADDNNPLLQPIHGITLEDYGAACAKISNNVSTEDVCKVLGIEQPVWDEVSTLWVKRMQEDNSFLVTNLFSKAFADVPNHPKLGSLNAAPLDPNAQANLDRLNSDRYFYEELCGARQAAYKYGLDGAQWIQDNYGITLGDFQGVAMKWMTHNNQIDSRELMHYLDFQQEKQKEYAASFAGEQGGNIADDVAF